MRTLARLMLVFPVLTVVTVPSNSAAATLSEVCASIDRLNRSVDALLQAEKTPPPGAVVNREPGLHLVHTYQLHLACLQRLHELEARRGIGRIPRLASQEADPRAEDLVALSDFMFRELKRPAWMLWVVRLPQQKATFIERDEDDAFGLTLNLYTKLCALAGHTEHGPDAVYPQLATAVAEAKSLLRHVDPAHRYRIDAPRASGGKSMADAAELCLAIRRTLNGAAEQWGLSPLPLPAEGAGVSGLDVFVQTQIILAELKRIKLAAGGQFAAAPVPAAGGKTMAGVYNEAVMLNYLLAQIPELRRMASP